MANVDTIDITKLILVEQGSTPSSPSAGKQKLYIRTSDHLLCTVDSSGTVTPWGGALTNPMAGVGDLIRGGSSGAPTRLAPSAAGKILTDGGAGVTPAWGQGPLTTDGDLLIGATAGTPTRLAKGVAGGILGMSNGVVSWIAGASFPGSPATNDVYFRTDLWQWYFYNGTRWLSVQKIRVPLGGFHSQGTATQNVSASTSPYERIAAPYLDGGSDMWVETFICNFFVASGGTALDGSNKWALVLKGSRDATANTLDTIGTITINSGSSQQTRQATTAINALMNNGTVHDFWQTDLTKTGTPGNFEGYSEVICRQVAT